MLPLRARVNLGAMKMYSAFPKAPALLKPHHPIILCYTQGTRWGNVTPLQRGSRCILHPWLTGKNIFWILPPILSETNIWTDFNGISFRAVLFYILVWRNSIHCTFIFTLLCGCFRRVFANSQSNQVRRAKQARYCRRSRGHINK